MDGDRVLKSRFYSPHTSSFLARNVQSSVEFTVNSVEEREENERNGRMEGRKGGEGRTESGRRGKGERGREELSIILNTSDIYLFLQIKCCCYPNVLQ